MIELLPRKDAASYLKDRGVRSSHTTLARWQWVVRGQNTPL